MNGRLVLHPSGAGWCVWNGNTHLSCYGSKRNAVEHLTRLVVRRGC